MSKYIKKVYAMVPCPTCSRDFVPKRSDTVFCSTKCAQRAKYARNPYNPETFGTGTSANRGRLQDPEHVAKRAASTAATLASTRRVCVKCACEFTPTLTAQRYCSGSCWSSASRAKKGQRKTQQRIKLHADHFAELLKLHDGKCGVCGSENGLVWRGRLAVDHCHEGGYIRGLLCHRCNTAIGLFKDDTARLQAAIDYLNTARDRMKKTPAY
jgi:hypothetical protein